MTKPCDQCPWRIANHGRRHSGHFYTQKNLRRLWNQVRRGGRAQGCHLTDPSHPDHVAAGCSPDAKPQECLGSVALVVRELEHMQSLAPGDVITMAHVTKYLRQSPRRLGLTREGLMWWLEVRKLPAFLGGIGSAMPDPGEWKSSAEIGRLEVR